MKPSISTSFLGRMWISFGLLIASGGIVSVTVVKAFFRDVVKVDISRLPAPLDFVIKNATTIGSIQIVVGIGLAIGGFALMRKRNFGKRILQVLSVALMPWFLFLSIYMFNASAEGRPLAVPAILPSGVGLLLLGLNLWALGRPSISAELSGNS